MSEHNWGAEEWRQPTAQEGDIILLSECGRVIKHSDTAHWSVDYRSHWFKLVKAGKAGAYYILVKHGGGEERHELEFHADYLVRGIETLDSDGRYMAMHTLYSSISTARRNAERSTSSYYQIAFLEGRLKRRKRNHRYYAEVLTPIREVAT